MGKGKGMASAPQTLPLNHHHHPLRSQVTIEGDPVGPASGSHTHNGSGLVEQVVGASAPDDHRIIQTAGSLSAERIETAENLRTIPAKGTPSAQLGEDKQRREYIKQALTDPALAQLQVDHSNSMIALIIFLLNNNWRLSVMKLRKMPAAPGLVEDGPEFVKATMILIESLLHIYHSTRRKAYKEDPHRSSTPMSTVTIDLLDPSFPWNEQRPVLPEASKTNMNYKNYEFLHPNAHSHITPNGHISWALLWDDCVALQRMRIRDLSQHQFMKIEDQLVAFDNSRPVELDPYEWVLLEYRDPN
ncbi:hypothetical protein BDQ17DRAFT_1427769 [Cyathus striatus]|nr:hypothetical protein BDQ17DRAFT_1427769 [Cyathus striatus]